MKLLLIEDNTALHTSLKRSLERQGMQVLVCADGARALARWQASLPDVVVLDLSLPGADGLHVLTLARAAGLTTPVLILTARSTVGDRVLGLNTGADDYLAKPFDLDELEARIRALARRASPAAAGGGSDAPTRWLQLGQLRMQADGGASFVGPTPLELSLRETTLLLALLRQAPQAVAKERLSELVFAGESAVQADAVEVVAYRVRKKLAGSGVAIVTLRGLGYLLREIDLHPLG